MDLHGWIALGTLAAAAALFLSRRLPLALVALAIPVVLFATGTLRDPADALAGFRSPALVALGAVFVLGAGLQGSGVTTLVARALGRRGRGAPGRLVLLVCLAAAALSAVMPNAAVVAVLLPAVLAVARRAGVAPALLLLPLSFAAILGGATTLIGTAPNLLLAESLREAGGGELGMFAFLPAALPAALLGIGFLALAAPRVLARREGDPESEAGATDPQRLVQQYGLSGKLTRLRIGRNSRLLGKSLVEAGLGRRYGVSVMAVEHAGGGPRWRAPEPDYRLQWGDDLYLEGDEEAVWRLAEEQEARIGLTTAGHADRVLDHGIVLAEAMVAPRSPAVGRTLDELEFRRRFGLSVLALGRGGRPLQEHLGSVPLAVGDTLLVAGQRRALDELRRDADFILLTDPAAEAHDLGKAPLGLLFLLVAVLPPVFGWAPFAISALAGAIGMAATGCVPLADSGRLVEWRVLALIAGTMPLGLALERHGVAAAAAAAVARLAAAGPGPALAGLYLLAALLTSVTSNAAAAVVLAPVALGAAGASGLDPGTAALAVALGCSCAFLVPFSNQCHLLVLGRGGYRPRDFLVLGLPVSLLAGAVVVGVLAHF